MNTVSERFHELASGSVRPLDWEVGISWSKARNTSTNWFTLDQSALNGSDLLSDSASNPIQKWDFYDYKNSRDRVLEMSVERSVAFPYNIQSAICDVKLNNYDGYYSIDNPDSPIMGEVLPSRPLRAFLGFREAGVTPVFVGLTKAIPTYSGTHNTTAQITALDFLSEIGETKLNKMIMMKDVRTDEVISAILQQAGLDTWMYNLDHGLNVIPFVYYDTEKDAGNALKELVQAENGVMWLDEQGIVRFSPRTAIIGSESVKTFTPSDIVSIKPSASAGIVNRVHVEADVRKVMNNQLIFSADNENSWDGSASDDSYRLKANGDTQIWVSFEDPIWQCQADPILNGADTGSAFTAVDLHGDAVNQRITAVGQLFATSMLITFTNTNNFPVSITYLQIFGEPAKVIGESPTITYTAEDTESIERFGICELSITDNKCFGNQQNIDTFAEDVLNLYSDYSPTLELNVKGDPSLQIQDVITLAGTDYDGDYLIKGMKHSLTQSKLETTITVIKHTVLRNFILDKSVLDGTDVLG